jgi:hypothetical protein
LLPAICHVAVANVSRATIIDEVADVVVISPYRADEQARPDAFCGRVTHSFEQKIGSFQRDLTE